jgi:hypothetical protein
MCMRGQYPIWIAARDSENVPEMTACDAITVAQVARTTMGINAHDGASR